MKSKIWLIGALLAALALAALAQHQEAKADALEKCKNFGRGVAFVSPLGTGLLIRGVCNILHHKPPSAAKFDQEAYEKEISEKLSNWSSPELLAHRKRKRDCEAEYYKYSDLEGCIEASYNKYLKEKEAAEYAAVFGAGG